MGSIAMTNHAAIRKQQRGITESVLDCLIQFGKTSHDNMGRRSAVFRQARQATLPDRVGQRNAS